MLVNRRLMALTRGHGRTLNALTVVVCLCTASYWVQAWFLANALAGLLPGQTRSAAQVTGNLLAVLGCGLARAALQQVQARLASTLGTAVRLELRATLASALLRPERLRDNSERGGARRLALSEGADGVEPYVTAYIPHALQLQVLCPILLAGVAVLNPVLAAALLAAVAVSVGAPRLWGRLLARRGATHWDSYEALGADFLEALQGMRTLKILDAVPRFRTRLQTRSDALHKATVATMRVSLADTALADLGIQAGLLAAAALTAMDVLGVLPGGLGGEPTLVFFTLILASEIFRPIRDLARQWHAGYLGISALGSIDAAIGADGEMPGFPARPELASAGADLADSADDSAGETGGRPPAGHTLALENLSFRYGPGSPWVLHHAAARIRRGGITAVAGPSGTGKSTLFDILLGFLPADGHCLLDGRPLQPGDVSVVSQHSYLFPGTIRANLAAVRPGADDACMRGALARAGLARELDSWSLGLDTVVSEAGHSFSGGQLQRLAVARAILADRPVLLLDEPTSALNPELAIELMESLRAEARNRIVVMIAHRAEALDAADTVLYLRDGTLHDGALRQDNQRETIPSASPEAL
ncbi:ABC transporter ATP-binding protein/permease [Paeniglutamicibacter sp. NPDC012692]|uniref:ABC transporter ATP-binding protein/permease n=1 Tax=Paeniglutamicibacter sp. NPDC012692 TaxID=3364388 RepID=UPI00369937E0